MHKMLVVARNEYISAVSSKAFLVGVAMMPLFMGGTFLVQYLTRDQVDISDRKVAVVDHTGKLYPVIAAKADERNATVFEAESGDRTQTQPRFLFERVIRTDSAPKPLEILLSERIKEKELFAFVIIGEDALSATDSVRPALAYHTETPSYSDLPNWLEQTTNAEIQRARMEHLDLDPAAVASVISHVPLRRFGLVEAGEDGRVIDAKEDNRVATFAVPFGGLMLMFMLVMTVAPTMLNNVLEEKMQKISEFLVSSVSPFQLMLGKLLSGIGVALTLSVIYLAAVYGIVRYFELQGFVPVTVYLWFMLFLLLALTIFGSIFSAIGAACSEIRDAQGLMTPVMLMVIIPMLCIGPVLASPSSTFSRLISLFPPATPMLMFARIAIPPGPQVWEVLLGCLLSLVFALCCVWAGGKIFRIGILSQGQAANVQQIAKWLLSNQ